MFSCVASRAPGKKAGYEPKYDDFMKVQNGFHKICRTIGGDASRSEQHGCAASNSRQRASRSPAARVCMVFVAALVSLFVLAGCQAPGPGLDINAPALGAICVGDVLKVSFTADEKMNQTQKVRADGKISLPIIGEVKVVGRRLNEIQAEVKSRYKTQLQNSEVIVTLESTANAVYVSGAVIKPGKVLLDRPMTALEAIMEVGGFAPEEAIAKRVTVIRNVNGQQNTQVLNLSPALKGRPVKAFYLRPYDIVYVPGGGY